MTVAEHPHTELNWFRDEWDEDGNHVNVFVELRYISPLTIQRALTKLDKIKKELKDQFRPKEYKPLLKSIINDQKPPKMIRYDR